MTSNLNYLVAYRRAELDRLMASRNRATVEQNNRMRGRYRRQADRHARKAHALANQILLALGAGPLSNDLKATNESV